ncbi:bifunctional diaminohydroxyphosphoribosylaminopyrimidine deaminase/5-amino-6-(5-phosphoribosylamino)uracil reductase RibD [Candidatus Pelagibacter sp.]|jgi:diaminohydroxyphosphoribosylaminopyrimidine deaminase/5-amino-6-(5-phosphoribosylamino)uracil reductase|nr:bifunctional diaminohydroxyphosphoribosylaminopyrimidine deaminase/5-amino-6-(5-phosphoribosylamino)uracil reductase RibD [Candidatus Pelagibacter sp.]
MSTRKDKFSKKDKKYMSLALTLASARHGLTGENPSVGCVIVKNDDIISIGQTGYNGRPHAEYNAIKNSNETLEGSTMYVTLEPCNHYGKTPPCTKEIIKNKISKIIYSVEDVDEKVKGKSLKILKSKNMIVKKGLHYERIINFYKPYFFNRKNKMPYVTGKIAVSKNNLIFNKGIKRITDIHSDKLTHFLRYKNDSLMISYKTLNEDNPKLDCRLEGLNKFSPKRIILDNKLEMNTNSYIFRTANNNNTIIFYKNAINAKISVFKKKGIYLIKSNLLKNGDFDIKIILKKLYILGCRNLLVEGGNILSKSFIKKKLFNQFYLYKSPNNLSKLVAYKDFNCFKDLSLKYKNKKKINTQLGKDSITLYKK